jgi:UDP:flavonoid glycosyltransferase YjiC (YdhE family)
MRVLMTCQPAFSHATQLVPLAWELERQGHQVRLATSPTMAGRLAEHGIDAVGYGPDWVLRPGDAVYERTVGPHLFFGFPRIPDEAALAALVAAGREFEADLVVRDYCEFAGWCAARVLDLPLVTQGIIHRLPPPAEDAVADLVGNLAGLAGVPPPAGREELLGDVYLDVVPAGFSCPWERGAALARPSRPSLFDGAGKSPAPSWLEVMGAERPLVYITLGTVFADAPVVWAALFRAVAELDADVLATTGGAGAAGLVPPPANVRVEAYVPQSQVLPRCAAVVCHAGFSTLIGAFSQGLPSVCLPLNGDQPVNATRCADVGAGINLAHGPTTDPRGPIIDPARLDPLELAAAIREVLAEPAYRRAAQQLGREIGEMPDATSVAALLTQVASEGPKTPPRLAGR